MSIRIFVVFIAILHKATGQTFTAPDSYKRLEGALANERAWREARQTLDDNKMAVRMNAARVSGVGTNALSEDELWIQRGSEFLSDGITPVAGAGHANLSSKPISPDGLQCFNQEHVGCIPSAGFSNEKILSLEVETGTGHRDMMKEKHPLDLLGHGVF